jgi:ADP-heptose:LPS heptosyltransferase
MVECIRLSKSMVTGDTGPMHVAVALGKPVVALFGPTDPDWTGPYGQLENVMRIPLPCAPCQSQECRYEKRFECLHAIRPEDVLAALLTRVRKG